MALLINWLPSAYCLLFSMTGFSTAGLIGRSNLTKSEMATGGTTPFVILVVIIILVLYMGVCQLHFEKILRLGFLHNAKKEFLCTYTTALCRCSKGITASCVSLFKAHILSYYLQLIKGKNRQFFIKLKQLIMYISIIIYKERHKLYSLRLYVY